MWRLELSRKNNEDIILIYLRLNNDNYIRATEKFERGTNTCGRCWVLHAAWITVEGLKHLSNTTRCVRKCHCILRQSTKGNSLSWFHVCAEIRRGLWVSTITIVAFHYGNATRQPDTNRSKVLSSFAEFACRPFYASISWISRTFFIRLFCESVEDASCI